MSKLMIELWREGEDIKCSHDIANITGDPRTPLLLASLGTMKGTTKRKIKDNLYIIHNSNILTMAQTEAKNPALTALHYQDNSKDIIILAHEVLVTFRHAI